MLVLDQVKKGDPRIRVLALAILLGFCILLTGLWYVQIVSRPKYEASQKVQSFRTVRVPAARGRILDRNGHVLADNQPRFNINLFLEDIRSQFVYEYTNNVKKNFIETHGRNPDRKERGELSKQARYQAVSNIVWQVSSAILPQPLVLNPYAFERHYYQQRALPMPIATDLTQEQIALFMERVSDLPGIELEVEAYRYYPHGPLAAHALGYVLRRDHESEENENEIKFSYPLPEYQGRTGLEGGYDEDLRGKAGARAILVNNVGYREKEETWISSIPGKNLVSTLDLGIQQAVENALVAGTGPDTRGAAVVMDCNTGDVLAMSSVPAYDPNMYVRPRDFPAEAFERLGDTVLTPQYNRALQGEYQPGSIFKIIVGLAAFEAGIMDLDYTVYNPGYFQLGRRKIKDRNAPIGHWAFKEAFKRSANTYFIDVGLKAGVDAIIEMGSRFGLGERSGVVQPRLERSGYFPEVGTRTKKDGSRWMDGDTANLCIGQGEVAVTPLQMAVMVSAIANGGKVLHPRLVMQLEDQDGFSAPEVMPGSRVERMINVNPTHLDWVRAGMRADVEEEHGTGRKANIPGMGIAGKTGTAQVWTPKGMDTITWFVSFAPFDDPKYAVVVMIESGVSGGATCVPKTKMIYEAIQKKEQGTLENFAVR